MYPWDQKLLTLFFFIIFRRRDDSDNSPPRKSIKQEVDSDISPPRQQIKQEVDSDNSPPRIKREIDIKQEPDMSPPRAKKTLDGKKAGLQDAKSLRSEMDDLKKREKDRFGKVSWFKKNKLIFSTAYLTVLPKVTNLQNWKKFVKSLCSLSV